MEEQRRGDEFLLVLVLLAVGKALLTRWLMLGPSDPFVTFAMEASVVVALLCTVDLIPRRRSLALDLLVYAILSAIMYGNLLYATYFNQLADPSMLQMAGQVGSVGDSVWALAKPIHILYLIDIPFLIAWAADIRSFSPVRPGRSRAVLIAATVGFVAAGIQIVVVSRMPANADGFSVAGSRGLGVYQIANLLRGREAVAAESVPVSTGDSTRTPGAVMEARMASVRDTQKGERIAGVRHGEFAGKDVFIIQVESFQALAFGATIDGQEITPNINRMANDSWVCSKAYSQTDAGNTADAEFIVNSSLLPPPGQAAAVAYADYEFPAMPRLLSRAGYRTFTLHANNATFWNRIALYPALGFDAYYDKDQIGTLDTMWAGSSDEAFFRKAEEIVDDEMSAGAPVYAQFITLSSHGPYTAVPQERRPVQLAEELRGSQAGEWLGSLSYADKAVGQFLDWLRATGRYDDSIVIVYGDHKALPSLDLTGPDKLIVEELLGRPYTLVDRQHIPLLIHLPGQKFGGTIDKTVGQVDIAPTVADLLGTDLSGVPHLGRSVFSGSRSFVMMRSYFPGGTVLDENSAYVPELNSDTILAMALEDGSPRASGSLGALNVKRGVELTQLSDQWAHSLPKRPDADGTVHGYIPVRVQSSYSTTGTGSGQ